MGRKSGELTPGVVDEQIQRLMAESYVAPEYLRLCQELFRAQYGTEKKLQARCLYPAISREEADECIRQGLPIIDADRIRFDEAELDDLVRKIGGILSDHASDGNSLAEQLLAGQRAGELSLCELARKAVADDREYIKQVSDRIGEKKEKVIFMAEAVVAPFLRACARPLRSRLNLETLPTGRCPLCGGFPLMARLRRSDGKRILECSLCNTEWAFKRLRCPFCGNEEQDSLGFFSTSRNSAHRVDKCDKCKAYLKTVDERRQAEDESRSLVVEDVATLYLDMLAEKEGYRSAREQLRKEENG